MRQTLFYILGCCLFIWVYAHYQRGPLSRPTDPDIKDEHVQAASSPEASKETPCKTDWQKCADNNEFAENSFAMIKGQSACKIETANRVRYGEPKWPSFWTGIVFSQYATGQSVRNAGKITLIESRAQVQNGFGAWVHVNIICNYDVKNDRVLDLNITE